MHSLCVKSMFRSSGVVRMDRRSEPTLNRDENLGMLWSFLGYGTMSILMAIAVSIQSYPVGEFLVVSFLSLFVYGGVAGQCSSTLFAEKELHVFGALPISAATHLASKISGSIAYYSLVCAGIAGPALLVILFNRGLIAGISWVVSIALCVVFLCFAAICAHSFSVRVVRRAKLRYVRTISSFVAYALVLAFCAVFLLSEFELSELGNSWNLKENPRFLLFPPYWFTSLLLFFNGHVSMTTFTGTLLAVFCSVLIGLYVFKRIDAAFLATLIDSSSHDSVSQGTRHLTVIFRSAKIGSLEYERVAMWKLAFSHFKYDSSFRSVLLSYFSIFFVWVILLIGQKTTTELLKDPITTSDPAWFLTFTSCVMFLFVFAQFEALRTSKSASASWVLLVSPLNVARFTAMVVDWIFVVVVLPLLVLIFIASSVYWQSLINALLYTITLGWLSYVAVNLRPVVTPALPFTINAGESHSSPRFCLNFLLTVGGGVVVFHALASWIYTNYTTYIASILLGVGACAAVRHLANRTYDRKFLNADLVS